MALAIFGVVLVVAADLLHRSQQISRRARNALPEERLWSALLEVSRSLDAALEITAPLPTTAADQVVFRRVRPDVDVPTAQRLPAQLGPTPAPVPAGSWNPYAANWCENITVARTAQGQLTWASSGGTTLQLADGVESFECQPAAGLQLVLVGRTNGRQVRVAQQVSPAVKW